MSGVRFELDRLVSYDRKAILGELRRVADLVDGPMTRAAFDRHARVDSSTVIRRFAGWRAALEAAGLGDRYSGRKVSAKMRQQAARSLSDQELLGELRAVAQRRGSRVLTREAFRNESATVNDSVYVRRFGSWSEALRRAGLEVAPLGRRWTDDDYFENLLAVWAYYGRAPMYAEMNRPPSRISGNGYAAKFGTWTRAKAAFVDRVNADADPPSGEPDAGQSSQARRPRPSLKPEDRRSIPLGLRYRVLRRDRFRCLICGRLPATDLRGQLHVDHVVPVAAGGKTVEGNLRALCADCNLGKGTKPEVR